jgi:hypothetical protein
MRSAAFVLTLDVRRGPRPPTAPGSTSPESSLTTIYAIPRRLATLAPHPLHRPAPACHSPWSECFERIVRKEGVGGDDGHAAPIHSYETKAVGSTRGRA